MIRAFLPPDLWDDPEPCLSEEESHHLAAVMRLQQGMAAELLDGAGRVASAVVLDPHRKHVRLRVLSTRLVPRPAPAFWLLQALVREQKMDWIVQKAVELGAAGVIPVQTDNAVVRIKPADAPRKAARWTAVALAACKQSSNPWLPLVPPPQPLDAILAAPPWPADASAAFGALLPHAVPVSAWLASLPSPLPPAFALAVGPEGDFTPAESSALLAAGFAPLSFGPLVFRVETASLYLLSALHAHTLPQAPANDNSHSSLLTPHS